MPLDAEGFYRPQIDAARCIHCGACRRVCPANRDRSPDPARIPGVFACWNKDQNIRRSSSSGGLFTALADAVFAAGGIVFGAAFDSDATVLHASAETPDDLARLRGSKYVQSSINDAFRRVKSALASGRVVLCTGTPCQVDGLKSFLGCDPENLHTCDFICHGVPSPGLFARYLEYLGEKYSSKVNDITFRHKKYRWQTYQTAVNLIDGRMLFLYNDDESFMYGFSRSITLRPCCYQCRYVDTDRVSDITLADFWGIGTRAPFKHNTRNGVSLALINTPKGQELFNRAQNNLNVEPRTIEEAKVNQTGLDRTVRMPTSRDVFFSEYPNTGYAELQKKYLTDKGIKRIIKRLVSKNALYHLIRIRDAIAGKNE